MVWLSPVEGGLSCASNQDATIDSCLVHLNDGVTWVWDVAFAHNFNDWEVKVVVAVLNLLDSHVLSREGVDSWRWRMKRNGDRKSVV